MRSKGAIIQPEAPMKMFGLAAETVNSIANKLVPGHIYRAEYLSKPKHNINCYARIPTGGLIIFDILTPNEYFLPPAAKKLVADAIGLECVPLLYRGLFNLEVIQDLLERDSVLGGVKIEGVVIKPARYDLYGTDKKVLLGKLVSSDFKERHKLEWKADHPNQSGIIQAIALALKTDARWQKQVQHLAERGELTDSPRDIGPLMKELKDDLRREEYDNVAAALVRHFWDDILRAAVRGFPEWYKSQLLADQIAAVGYIHATEGAEPERSVEDTPAWRLK